MQIEDLADIIAKHNILLARVLYAVGSSKDRRDMCIMFPGYQFSADRGTEEKPHSYRMEEICFAVHQLLRNHPTTVWTGSAEHMRKELGDSIPIMTAQELGCLLGRLAKPSIIRLYQNVWSIKGERIQDTKPMVWAIETRPKYPEGFVEWYNERAELSIEDEPQAVLQPQGAPSHAMP